MKCNRILLALSLLLLTACTIRRECREIVELTSDWRFQTGDPADAYKTGYQDSTWRCVDIPHDWSIEADFSEKNPATPGGGALPGGIGWYRKTFKLDKSCKGKRVYVEFDGVYRNSTVWINGHELGFRASGYSSFSYDLTPYVNIGKDNVLAVRVDNSKQPNSRWYSGSGIYRNVRLVLTYPVHVDYMGTHITTTLTNPGTADIGVSTTIRNTSGRKQTVRVEQLFQDKSGRQAGKAESTVRIAAKSVKTIKQHFLVNNPKLWRLNDRNMYTCVTRLFIDDKQMDEYETTVGIRSLRFDAKKGFFLNGVPIKINGVCLHHDLGALGAAVNERAIERQLELLQAMGCNAIRTSHNPPAPELLNLCDKMGFLVLDEAFDVWTKSKTPYDYSVDFIRDYERDLTDMIKRDRNHPSVIMWSIGNEVGEQWPDDKSGTVDLHDAISILGSGKNITAADLPLKKSTFYSLLTAHMAELVKKLDPHRPVTAACNETNPENPLFKSGALDIIGYNYHHNEFAETSKRFPGKPFIATETVSSLMSRGVYMNPSTTMNIWPERWDKPFSHSPQQCSSYDNCHAPWGSTHEETWREIRDNPHVLGQFIWTGFDYLGEPTPYGWPSRSSYFGIIDLAGFPKDVYYMYQSEWTTEDVLHIFPHWNWKKGDVVDVMAYFNNADEVILYLNDKSLGARKKKPGEMHVTWSVPYEPGTLRAESYKDGRRITETEVKTAGPAASIQLTPDKLTMKADGKDLSYITVEVVDRNGTPLPDDNREFHFSIEGRGRIVGTVNGDPTDTTSLKSNNRKLFNGKCVVIVQSKHKPGIIRLDASTSGLKSRWVEVKANE